MLHEPKSSRNTGKRFRYQHNQNPVKIYDARNALEVSARLNKPISR